MMAMLGQWLGFENKQQQHDENQIIDITSVPSNTSSIHHHHHQTQPGIVIHNTPLSSNTNDSTYQHPQTLRKTKSDELLRDFEVMRFLSHVDQRLKQDGVLLSKHDLDRLKTLHAQAVQDNNLILTDIVEHFEAEYDKLRLRLQSGGPSSAAADALSINTSKHTVVY